MLLISYLYYRLKIELIYYIARCDNNGKNTKNITSNCIIYNIF